MSLKILLAFIALLFLANSFILTKKLVGQDSVITPNSAVFVVFTGIYPDEKLQPTDKIYLRGDNCNMTWNSGSPMKLTSANTWSLMLLCPTNTTIQVKLLLNDKNWMMGANKWFIANDRLTVTIYPSFSPSINKVYDTEAIKSTILGNSRKCSIYLPPSYHDNTFKKYPLLFMHDGQNLFEDSKAAFGTAWKIQDTLNLLIPEGSIDEVIVVGIWNTNNRNNEYTYSYDPEYKFGGKGDQYLDFIQQELEPIVSKKWFVDRIDATGGYLIGGSSLGGLISCYAMYKRSDFFRSTICMSSSFWWNSEDFTNKILTNAYDQRTFI
jgi:predicted alpha/beta superfamily hydrolase